MNFFFLKENNMMMTIERIFKKIILELYDKCHKSQLDVNDILKLKIGTAWNISWENNWKSSLNYIIIYLYVIINHERTLNLTITLFFIFWKKESKIDFGKFFLLLHNSNNKIRFEFYTSVSSKSIIYQNKFEWTLLVLLTS